MPPRTAPRHSRLHLVLAAIALSATAAVGALTVQPVAASSGAPVGPAAPIRAVSVNHPLHIVASPHLVHDSRSTVWTPDGPYATGGHLIASASAIRHTSSPALYQRGRLGGYGYHIPVAAPGTYFVDLYTAETRGAHPGQRVWDVTAERRSVARYVDAAASAGPNTAWHVMFFTIVTDGTLNLHIIARSGQPIIGAVEVDWVRPDTVNSAVFTDNFRGPAGQSPSRLKWKLDTGGNGFGHGEKETYSGRPRNVSLDGQGHLFITARREQYAGPDGISRNFTSGRIHTAGRFNFEYGTVTARIKIPGGAGLWPAFWALGSDISTTGWPLCGEMDIMENIGRQPRIAHATIHSGTSSGAEWLSGASLKLSRPVSADYHVYRMVWGPSGIAISSDGRTFLAVSKSDTDPSDRWTFSHRFFLVLNLAVGGGWPGDPTRRTPFPAVMSVDYVRVRG